MTEHLTRRHAVQAAAVAGASLLVAAPGNDLTSKSAVELAAMIRRRTVSAVEVLEAHLKQIERINPQVNAIVTLVPEMARESARKADEAIARNAPLGPLHGLPIAHKDLQETKGIRTTFGFPPLKDNIPTGDSLTVERLKRAGAITIGKTNTPEFGAGSQTFNKVFGATKNPYALTKTCGGSSGGAAVSLATNMLPIADGSDFGGSLRNPASWCNVVGFRTCAGRVPRYPAAMGWFGEAVDGPMARSVADVALLLSALAGPDARSPLSLADPGSRFAQPLTANVKGRRVAWFKDLGGLPFEKELVGIVNQQRQTFESLGFIVEQAEPDFKDADFVFKTLRAWLSYSTHSERWSAHPELYKETLRDEIARGSKLSGADIAKAETQRTALYHRMRMFFEKYDYFVLPVTQVAPFDVTQEFPPEINGVAMTSYIDWMKSCYYISATGLPAISVPAGFTAAGLPIGLQIVGKQWGEWAVLQAAHAYEQATLFGQKRPSFS